MIVNDVGAFDIVAIYQNGFDRTVDQLPLFANMVDIGDGQATGFWVQNVQAFVAVFQCYDIAIKLSSRMLQNIMRFFDCNIRSKRAGCGSDLLGQCAKLSCNTNAISAIRFDIVLCFDNFGLIGVFLCGACRCRKCGHRDKRKQRVTGTRHLDGPVILR